MKGGAGRRDGHPHTGRMEEEQEQQEGEQECAPQHSPCPTEETLITNSSTGSPIMSGRPTSTGYQPEPSFRLSSLPGRKTSNSSSATLCQNQSSSHLNYSTSSDQSSFSKFVVHAKSYWADLGTEAIRQRHDSLTPYEDIKLYPSLHDSLNEASFTEMEQAVRKKSRNTVFLEKFLHSHQEKMKGWKLRDEEKKLDQSSMSISLNHSHEDSNLRRSNPVMDQSSQSQIIHNNNNNNNQNSTLAMDRSAQSHASRMDRSNQSYSSVNNNIHSRRSPTSSPASRQAQMEFTQRYASQANNDQNNNNDNNPLEESIFDMFERRRNEQQKRKSTPTNAPPSTRQLPDSNRSVPSRDSSLNSDASSNKTPFEQLYEKHVVQQQKRREQPYTNPNHHSPSTQASPQRQPSKKLSRVISNERRRRLSSNNQKIAEAMRQQQQQQQQPIRWQRRNLSPANQRIAAAMSRQQVKSQQERDALWQASKGEEKINTKAKTESPHPSAAREWMNSFLPDQSSNVNHNENAKDSSDPTSSSVPSNDNDNDNEKDGTMGSLLRPAAVTSPPVTNPKAIEDPYSTKLQANSKTDGSTAASASQTSATNDVVDPSYPAQHAKDIMQLTSTSSGGSDHATVPPRGNNASLVQPAQLEREVSITTEFLGPAINHSARQNPSSRAAAADASEKARSRSDNHGATNQPKPGAYQEAPGKSSTRNDPIRNSLISQRSMSAQMSNSWLDASFLNSSSNSARDSNCDAADTSVGSTGLSPNKRRHARRRATAESKTSTIDHTVVEGENENSTSDISAEATTTNNNAFGNEREELFDRKVAASLVLGSKSEKEEAYTPKHRSTPNRTGSRDRSNSPRSAPAPPSPHSRPGTAVRKVPPASSKDNEDSAEEKEEIQSLDESGEDIVPPLLPINGRSLGLRRSGQRDRSPTGTRLSRSGSGNGSRGRLMKTISSSSGNSGSSRFNGRPLSDYLNIYDSSSQARRKPSTVSELSGSNHTMDDSHGSHMSWAELQRRVGSMASGTSSSNSSSAAASESAGRIARNMSLYMRAGGLPVAATVVDDDGNLEAELREQLEKEIRQELEIEMEEFRRRVVAEVFSAAEPLIANVISVREEEAEDAVNLQAVLLERERMEAAAIRSNMNQALGRMYMDMKRSKSAAVLAVEEEPEQFYDEEELVMMTRVVKKNNPSITSWNNVWIVVVVALLSGLLLGMGIMSAAERSK